MRILLALAPLALAWAQPPTFSADRVLPSGGQRLAALAPGMLISIYGDHLGPAQGCTGNADTQRKETPSPTRPHQSFAETLIFPTELCGVQVFLADRAAGLLYAQEKQINFKVPQESPVQGVAELRVVYRGEAASVKLRVGLETAALSVDGEARVGGPVWIRIDPPFGWYDTVRYPVSLDPADFGCNEIEVRRDGQPLPRMVLRPSGPMTGGLPCGAIGIAHRPATHTGRLPAHLQYRFDKPGAYEVRYTRWDFGRSQVQMRSDWTRIELFPARVTPGVAPQIPADPEDLISDYLPGLLGFGDNAALEAVVACLYHPEDTVRRYAVAGLVYWPEDVVQRRLREVFLARGPSDVVVDRAMVRDAALLERAAPWLRSGDPVLLRGAVTAASRLLLKQRSETMEQALLDSADHVVRDGDEQTVIYYVSTLGQVRDDRASRLLWDLVSRRVQTGQALIAITWRKDARDLPRLAAVLEGPVRGEQLSYEVSHLPGSVRSQYGDAALPWLESVMKNSAYEWIRVNCAKELIAARRPAGLKFAADAIRAGKPYQGDLAFSVRDQFPELKDASDAKVLEFLDRR